MMKKTVTLTVALATILTGFAFAQTPSAGFRMEAIPNTFGLGPSAAYSETEILVAMTTGFSPPTFKIVKIDTDSGASSDFIADVSGYIGGLYHDVSTGRTYLTENFDLDTLLMAEDLNSDGDALDAGEVSEVLPVGSIPFAAQILPSVGDEVLVADSAGAGAGSIVAVDTVAGTTSAYATGLDYTAGMAWHPTTGELYVANSVSFASPGVVYRLLGDTDTSGTIEVGLTSEAEMIYDGAGAVADNVNDLIFESGGSLILTTNQSEVYLIEDTDSDNVPDTPQTIATGFEYCGGASLWPPDGSFVPDVAGALLYVCDPWSFSGDSRIQIIQGVDPAGVWDWMNYR